MFNMFLLFDSIKCFNTKRQHHTFLRKMFYMFQELQSQISKFDNNGDETLHNYGTLCTSFAQGILIVYTVCSWHNPGRMHVVNNDKLITPTSTRCDSNLCCTHNYRWYWLSLIVTRFSTPWWYAQSIIISPLFSNEC